MVALEIVEESNSQVATLPKGLVAFFIGATSGIGRSALEHLAKTVKSPRIYTVARPQSAASHEDFLASLRQSNPSGTYTLIVADHTLVSDIDRAVKVILEKETKLDILILPPVSSLLKAGRTPSRASIRPCPHVTTPASVPCRRCFRCFKTLQAPALSGWVQGVWKGQ